MAVASEDVMVEERLPRLALDGRPLRDRDYREQEAGVGCVRTDAEGVPPVIDQAVERGRRFDLVPPQLGQVEGVSGLELHRERQVPNLREQGKLLKPSPR